MLACFFRTNSAPAAEEIGAKKEEETEKREDRIEDVRAWFSEPCIYWERSQSFGHCFFEPIGFYSIALTRTYNKDAVIFRHITSLEFVWGMVSYYCILNGTLLVLHRFNLQLRERHALEHAIAFPLGRLLPRANIFNDFHGYSTYQCSLLPGLRVILLLHSKYFRLHISILLWLVVLRTTRSS